MESLVDLPIHKPIIVHVDNVGAIFVAENLSATKHTRHIYAWYHLVREYIIDVSEIIAKPSRGKTLGSVTKSVDT
jgi:hypothetical protein